LPVTYYELIPTAPVKYYCKILTVICARACERASERASERAARANELRRPRIFVTLSISFRNLFRPGSRQYCVFIIERAGRAEGRRGRRPAEIKVLIRGFPRERERERDEGRSGSLLAAGARISIISRIILRLGYVTSVKYRYYNIVSANLLVVAAAGN